MTEEESQSLREILRRIERVELTLERTGIEDQSMRVAQGISATEQKSVFGRLDKIESVLARLTWLVISAVIGSAILFMLKGGFNGTFPLIP